MNESSVARKIIATLDADPRVDPEVAARLALMRGRALERHRAPEHAVAVAGPSRLALRQRAPRPIWSRVLLPLIMLVAALIGVQRWEDAQRGAPRLATPAADIEEIDARLLNDDLPIDAYFDEQFRSWLKRAAE